MIHLLLQNNTMVLLYNWDTTQPYYKGAKPHTQEGFSLSSPPSFTALVITIFVETLHGQNNITISSIIYTKLRYIPTVLLYSSEITQYKCLIDTPHSTLLHKSSCEHYCLLPLPQLLATYFGTKISL